MKLKKRKFRTPLPTVVFGNVRSLNNKTVELVAATKFLTEYKNCCLMCFTETWLHESVPDSHIQIDGFQLARADRTRASGKKKGVDYVSS